MAVDIASQHAAGAAMGLVGAFSYCGAAVQNSVTGYLVDLGKQTVGAEVVYRFDRVFAFWIGTSVLSLLLVASLWRRTAARTPGK
jgi:OPA family sugar phosphate sensor protein UhpC-like MFS transporter